jgi:hypothetical protein
MRSPRRRPRQKRSKAAATPNPGLLVGPGYAHFGRDTSSNVATGPPWPVDDIVPYWDTGGFGGPAGATAGAAGGSAATGANADGGGADAAVDCVETGSEPPLEAAVEGAGAGLGDGAGAAEIAGGAGSGRVRGVSLSLGGSTLAACGVLSPAGLAVSKLSESTFAEPLAGGATDAGSSFGGSDFCRSLKNSLNGSFSRSRAASSPPGLLRLLSFCLVECCLRPSAARSPACAGT